MTSVNIRLEVSDDIYNNVIRPLKDERRLQQFLRSVFENYMTNDDFRTFMDGGSLYADDEEITQLFNKLNEANTLAATGGFLVDSLTSEVKQGIANLDNGFVVDSSNELNLDDVFSDNATDQAVQESTITTLEEKVNNIESSISELRSMFKSFIQETSHDIKHEITLNPVNVQESENSSIENSISQITPIAVASDDEEIEGINILDEFDDDFEEDEQDTPDDGLDPLMSSAFMSI